MHSCIRNHKKLTQEHRGISRSENRVQVMKELSLPLVYEAISSRFLDTRCELRGKADGVGRRVKANHRFRDSKIGHCAKK